MNTKTEITVPVSKSRCESPETTQTIFSRYTGWKEPQKNNPAGGKKRKVRAEKHTGAEISESQAARSASLMVYVNALWRLSRNTIYKDVFLTDGQVKTAKSLLRLWYEPVADKKLAKVHEVYVQRIALVRKFLDKDPENRYVQLPNRYFDPKNPSGFTGTKVWYNNHKKRQEEVRFKLILQAQIRRFINNENKQTAKQKPRLVLFRQCETRISKLGVPDLLKQFHASVLNHSSYTFLN